MTHAPTADELAEPCVVAGLGDAALAMRAAAATRRRLNDGATR